MSRGRAGLAVRVALTGCLLAAAGAAAHDAVDAAAADGLVEEVARLKATAEGEAAPAEKAAAWYALGAAVESLRADLNRDLAAHGGEPGLVAAVIVAELGRLGIALSPWPQAVRYRSQAAPFRAYLALPRDGPRAADARFALLRAGFYDSYTTDPLSAPDLDRNALAARIGEAEDFLARHPDHEGVEEARFILAVDYFRAVQLAPDPIARERARAALAGYADAYPETLRARAARALLDRLAAMPGSTP
ncbi:MAG: hypothetical protein WD099_02050 [Dongiaceae bacterium]